MGRKVCVVITARPSYARIRSALTAIKARGDLELQLVVAASALLDRYGNAANVIEAEGFRIDRRVDSLAPGDSLSASAITTGRGLIETAEAFMTLKPDLVVTVADRYETLATAVAAAYMNIPLAHVQGGEVTGSIDEKVRHAVTKLADLHLVASKRARERVMRMGERPETVHVTGCPSIDVAKAAIEAGAFDPKILSAHGVAQAIDPARGYLVLLQHPVTTEHEAARAHIRETLQAVGRLGLPTLWFWPNVDAGSDGTSEEIRAYRHAHGLAHVHFLSNLPPEDFIRLLAGCRAILGNSSVAIRECAWLGVPAVDIGNRQAGRDRGANARHAGYVAAEIEAIARQQIAHGRYARDLLYGEGDAGPRIAKVLAEAPLTIEKRLTY